MTPTPLICQNGRIIPAEEALLHVNDGGFLFGDSLFETLKANYQQLILADRHLDRLAESARQLDFPCERQALEDALHQLAELLEAPISRVRLTISRGPQKGLAWPENTPGHSLITAVPYQEPDQGLCSQGISCIAAPNQRVNPFHPLPQLKHGNYADCLYAYNRARQAGADEALFMTNDGLVLEATTANIFALIEDRLVSPPPGHLVLDGIMRREVVKTAEQLGIPTVERDLRRQELLTAQEVFLTNSLIDILPVASFDSHSLSRGQCWSTLLKTLRERIAI